MDCDGVEQLDAVFKPVSPHSKENPNECAESSIDIDSQSVTENVPLTGIGFDLIMSTMFSGDRSDHYTAPVDPAFISNGATFSAVHFLNRNLNVMYFGDGRVLENVKTTPLGGNFMVLSVAGDEVYIFDSVGKHLFTKSPLTGATILSMNYDGNGRLISVADSFGNQVNIGRDSAGNLTMLTSPYGQINTIGLNSQNLISSITNPKNETYSFTFKAGTSLFETFTKPGGQVSSVLYNSFGRVIKDTGNGGNFWAITQGVGSSPGGLTKTSSLGRATGFYVDPSNNNVGRARYESSGKTIQTTEGSDGSTQIQDSSSAVYETTTSDERFGSAYLRLLARRTTKAGIASTETFSQTVQSTNVTDPFGFTSLTRTATRGGNTTTTSFSMANRTETMTTPSGAIRVRQFDAFDRPVSDQLGNDTPRTFAYDANGRLHQIAQGTHNVLTFTYNSLGQLQKMSNVRGEDTTFTYDLAGRRTVVTYPNLTTSQYQYDLNGNLTGVTPPGRPQHIFGLNAMELISSYQPPALSGLATKDTTFSYNMDRQLIQISRPNGQVLNYNYGSASVLLSSITWNSTGNYFNYLSNDDRISSSTSSDGIGSNYTYYGDQLASAE